MPEIALSALPLDYPHSGSAVYARNLIAHLPATAPDLGFRVVRRNAKAVAGVPNDRALSPFASLNRGSGTGARLDKLAWEVGSFPVAAALRRADLLHSLYFAAPLVASAPIVVTVHDVIPLVLRDYHRGGASRAYSALMRWAVPRARAIITVSEHAKLDIIATLRVDPGRIYVTPEAADDVTLTGRRDGGAEIRSRYRLPERYVLYLGGAERRKNVETLVRAWATVARTMRDREVSLVIVARFPPPDPLYPDVPGLIESLGLRDSVLVLPSVHESDKGSLYRSALLLCFPSTYEGFGLPPLEAMACGTPVIAANASSIPEVVGDAAWLIDPADVSAWAEAMVRLVDDDTARADLSRRGLQRSSLFSWRSTAEGTAAVYREVLGG